ncbi:DEAD/DEAH box helicase [Pseudactinotalea suaedae]|uniref:DEAD/DEAH box helicase n=1 Tax=Pseudactinotalea suaedae TaxID=1524924 RepID=UPI0018833330|nr:DEAD/DEAH box helicase [Pseudactinotalea suaedae]
MTFGALGVPASLVTALAKRGIDEPFPIQTATLPDTLRGRDVLGRGRTGSGKTLAFSLPLVARLADGGRPKAKTPRALILAPTRELASQIAETLAPLAESAGLKHTVIFGGVGQNPQVKALAAGVDVVIACPGRLEDLLGQGALRLDEIEITVLDEADHMADLGFLPGVKRILDRTPRGGQRMLFSATLDNGVDVLVKRYLSDPVTHSVDSASSPVAAMTHHVFNVAGKDEKRDVVEHLASGNGRRLLFTRTKHQAKRLAQQLTTAGIPAVDLHGNLSQNARQRNLEAFSSGAVRVLVATDIAARGIHVDDVELVVHVDPPAEHKAYLHRSGRTARAGAGGDVVTIVLPEQRGDMRSLARAAKIAATPIQPTAEQLSTLVGAVAPKVAPTAKAAPAGRGEPAARGPRRAGGQRADRPADTAHGGSGGGRNRRRGGGQGGRPGGAGGRSGGQGARSGGQGGSAPVWSSSTSQGSSGSQGGSRPQRSDNAGAPSGGGPRRGPRRATRDSGMPRG